MRHRVVAGPGVAVVAVAHRPLPKELFLGVPGVRLEHEGAEDRAHREEDEEVENDDGGGPSVAETAARLERAPILCEPICSGAWRRQQPRGPLHAPLPRHSRPRPTLAES